MANKAQEAYARRQVRMVVTAVVLAVVLAGVIAKPYLFKKKTQAAKNPAAEMTTKPAPADKPMAEIKTAPAPKAPANGEPRPAALEWELPDQIAETPPDPFALDLGPDPASAPGPQTASEPVQAKDASPDFKISGIVFSRERPTVIIDGHLLRKGDRHNGYTITSIDKDRVEFARDDRIWVRSVRE
ncbi:MAG: hypothetical protein IH624_06715 [Phycisphaerae bacterium]|nr:hypothetical protein [Phycisphaerae bacterium]